MTPRKIAPRVILSAIEGFGKTTFGAFAPSPLILMSRGETGYETLLSAGRVPAVPAYRVDGWAETMSWVTDLTADPQGIQTLVLDCIDGFEHLCHEHVCNSKYGGDWGDRGFLNFRRGYETSMSDFLQLLFQLERLSDRGVTTVLLCHAEKATFKNPMGSDFDRYVGGVNQAHTWPALRAWADVLLFGTFKTIVDKDKGIGGTDRLVYTERRDAFDAKNRFGMPPEIPLLKDPAGMWSSISKHFTKG